MKKKVIVGILVIIIVGFCLVSFGSKSITGTITGFDNETVIVTSEDGTQVFHICDYLNFIPTGESWSIGDTVVVRYRGSIQETEPAAFDKVTGIYVK